MMGVKEMGEGEQLHERKRKQFWRTLGFIALVGIPIGGAVGYASVSSDGDLTAFWRGLSPPVALVIVTAAVLLFSYGCWRFAKAIDEVETQDNLWGSTAAYYVYSILFPAWWALAQANVVMPPHDWAIYLVALAGGMLAYGWRKWQAR